MKTKMKMVAMVVVQVVVVVAFCGNHVNSPAGEEPKTMMEMVGPRSGCGGIQRQHWPATFAGRPGTNEDDDGDGAPLWLWW